MSSGRRLASARPAARVPHPTRGFVKGRTYTLFMIASSAVLVVSLFVAMSIGSVNIPVGTVWRVVWDHMPWVDGSSQPVRQDAIIWNFRVPRALLAAVVGASLSVAGAALQAAVRNPLAEPYVLGVVQGASFGAVLTIAIGSAAVRRPGPVRCGVRGRDGCVDGAAVAGSASRQGRAGPSQGRTQRDRDSSATQRALRGESRTPSHALAIIVSTTTAGGTPSDVLEDPEELVLFVRRQVVDREAAQVTHRFDALEDLGDRRGFG